MGIKYIFYYIGRVWGFDEVKHGKPLAQGLEHGHSQKTGGLLLLLLLLPSSTLLVVIHLLGLICHLRGARIWVEPGNLFAEAGMNSSQDQGPPLSKPLFLNKCQSPTAQPTQSQWPGRLAPCREVLNRRSGLSRCHLAGLSKVRPGFRKFRKVGRKLSAQEGLAVL